MITLKIYKEVYAKILKDGYVTKDYLHFKFKELKLARVLLFFEKHDMTLYDETIIIPNFRHKTIKETRYYSLNAIYKKWREEGRKLPKNGRIRTGERGILK